MEIGPVKTKVMTSNRNGFQREINITLTGQRQHEELVRDGFGYSLRIVEDRERPKAVVAKSSVMPR